MIENNSGRLGVAYTDKYWNERNVEQKLDALRDEVVNLICQVTHAFIIADKLTHHSHVDGKIVAPIETHVAQRDRHIPIALQKNHERLARGEK